MEIGYCAPVHKSQLLEEIGYDYIELELLAYDLHSDEGLAEAKRSVATSTLPTPAFRSFFPRDMRLVGPGVDEFHIKQYLARAADLTSTAGAAVAVMGSAWSRNVPEGFDRARAEEQLLRAYDWAADAFEGTDVVVGIEPQNAKEANIVLTFADGVEYARKVNRPNIRAIADFYHMDENGEPLSDISRYGDWLVHVQVADTGRQHPGTGSYDYDTFAAELAKIGYDERISVEIMHDISPEEMAHSLGFLRGHWPR